MKILTGQPGLYSWDAATLEWHTGAVVGAIEEVASLLVARAVAFLCDPENCRMTGDGIAAGSLERLTGRVIAATKRLPGEAEPFSLAREWL